MHLRDLPHPVLRLPPLPQNRLAKRDPLHHPNHLPEHTILRNSRLVGDFKYQYNNADEIFAIHKFLDDLSCIIAELKCQERLENDKKSGEVLKRQDMIVRIIDEVGIGEEHAEHWALKAEYKEL